MAKQSKTKKTPTKKLSSTEVGDFIKQVKAITPASASVDSFATSLNLNGPLLLLSDESLRVKRLVNWLIETAFPKDTEVIKFFGGEITNKAKVQEIRSALSSGSLFATNQCHVIFNIDQIKAAQFFELENALQQKFVILTAPFETKKGSAVEKLTKFSAVRLEPLKGTNLVKWIAKEVSDLGAAGIETGAAELLARCFEGNLDHLQMELAKLALIAKKGEQITLSLVQEHSQANLEKSSFDLLEAISKRDLPGATFLTHKLLAQGSHPLQLCAFLSKTYRVMAANYQTLSGGPTSSSSELGNKWFVSKLAPTMRRFKPQELFSSIEVLKDLDQELKGSSLPERTVVDIAMQKLTLRAS